MCRTKRKKKKKRFRDEAVFNDSKRKVARDERMEGRRGWRGKGIDPHGRSRVERRAI